MGGEWLLLHVKQVAKLWSLRRHLWALIKNILTCVIPQKGLWAFIQKSSMAVSSICQYTMAVERKKWFLLHVNNWGRMRKFWLVRTCDRSESLMSVHTKTPQWLYNGNFNIIQQWNEVKMISIACQTIGKKWTCWDCSEHVCEPS